ncbi:TPA: recombinase family protein [Streptococcus equi subsp. zooepidemicus]|uniref:recombinase family protein n=1 Tax=Streptococcus equi TaxID=1336 RepID=UPI001E5CD565|nr:recombinase family protein [Streptococcus equi]HEL0860439.1 recombinase family protein [Streptococcus equi subsp. equi]MCD3372250.1 recombinase family protein [Streptococcus equi subsp. zooepidemicus]HEL0066110.1 recombinase family protein [Streptococcus equi subsp. zooepidemicus]HEL0074289.1 recombinase family protein [Streptococcus equi subsp. zooepidemicus]HEL0088580.1 recombinase family protein [Streptococcus equi subsp. zooepidemicus]
MFTTRKVAIYVRVSTTNQAEEGYSIQGQLDSLTKYCEAMGWIIYQEYTDAGFSGGKIDRPAMSKLITDAKHKRFDTILVYKLDRLSRSVRDTLYLVKDVFNQNNIHFVSLQENIDTSSAMGNLFLTLLSAIAEFEREQITERMTMGKIGRAKSGKTMAWTYTPFGYDYNKEKGELILDPAKAPIVKMIYTDYIKGMSIQKIVDKLNKMDYNGKDCTWFPHGVKHLLDNPVYYGMTRYNNKLFPGNHQPIITKELFDKTQRERQRRRLGIEENHYTIPFQAKYMLSKFLRCRQCGSRMGLELGRPRKKDGKRSKKYYCLNSRPKRTASCDTPLYDAETLEDYVLHEIAKIQKDPSIASRQKHIEDHELKYKRERIEANINKTVNQLSKLNNLYLNDLITLEDLKTQTNTLIAKKRLLENELDKTYDNDDELDRQETIADFLALPDVWTMDYEGQKYAVELLVQRVKVDRDNIDIHWTF